MKYLCFGFKSSAQSSQMCLEYCFALYWEIGIELNGCHFWCSCLDFSEPRHGTWNWGRKLFAFSWYPDRSDTSNRAQFLSRSIQNSLGKHCTASSDKRSKIYQLFSDIATIHLNLAAQTRRVTLTICGGIWMIFWISALDKQIITQWLGCRGAE